ncbi:hypothetical protein RND71_030253 [Anisodus tanguticus]|uniref:Purple acid phosphatase C-terminal domain-containing protein n=1 Tax=Anisodus tanguticus TaxID=243964 RepID=A0AAE1RG27_9SOLA|nr:hypothetical protein RND71_030253 [Anisodus tanguticus]
MAEKRVANGPSLQGVTCHGEQPLSRIAIHNTVLALDIHASIKATPSVLGVNPKLVAVSKIVAFANPNAPVYPRLAQGKMWNEDEADGSNEYNKFQPGSRNTTNQLINDLKNIDIVFHIGDICYANGYISQWDQFTSQIEPIASTVPYMLARQKQPWLIFLAHRVLGYSSGSSYADQGSLAEPMGRESLQKLWQNYKVDIAIFSHVHNYERTCPIYQNICTHNEKRSYKGALNGTIHVAAGRAGASLSNFTPIQTKWSIFRDYDHGFVKLTTFDHSNLLFEYKKSRDGKVYDSFRISRDYRDILPCTIDSCLSITLAS